MGAPAPGSAAATKACRIASPDDGHMAGLVPTNTGHCTVCCHLDTAHYMQPGFSVGAHKLQGACAHAGRGTDAVPRSMHLGSNRHRRSLVLFSSFEQRLPTSIYRDTYPDLKTDRLARQTSNNQPQRQPNAAQPALTHWSPGSPLG
jgi:hypothetical protein